jgi:hypothetical protein
MTFAAVVLATGQTPGPQLNPERAVVLSAGDGTRQIVQCSREVPGPVTGTWSPDPETIRRFDVLLAPALQVAINHEQPDASKRPPVSGYYRQYFGLVVDGHRIVYVNGFHEVYLKLEGRVPRGQNWRIKAVNACDGWTLFFGAEYDLVSRQIQHLRFNGQG